LTFKRSGLGYRISPSGQSARAWWTVREEPDSPSVLRVLREFLRVLCSIHSVGRFVLHEVRGRSVLECQTVRGGVDSLRAHHGRSVIDGVVLEVWECFLDSPPQLADGSPYPRGRSARRSRTVRLVVCRTAKSFAS
jgi:hypothetical protein